MFACCLYHFSPPPTSDLTDALIGYGTDHECLRVGRERTAAAGITMMKITRMTTVVKDDDCGEGGGYQILASARADGLVSFGRAAKKEGRPVV